MNGDNSATPPRELPPRDVTVQLFDPSSRQPVKTWTFSEQPTITIGRGDTADVLISDAYVSRVHAELAFRDNQWILISRGRNGVLIGSQVITETPILGEVSFRLGSA